MFVNLPYPLLVFNCINISHIYLYDKCRTHSASSKKFSLHDAWSSEPGPLTERRPGGKLEEEVEKEKEEEEEKEEKEREEEDVKEEQEVLEG